jgi:hypothetical protein
VPGGNAIRRTGAQYGAHNELGIATSAVQDQRFGCGYGSRRIAALQRFPATNDERMRGCGHLRYGATDNRGE